MDKVGNSGPKRENRCGRASACLRKHYLLVFGITLLLLVLIVVSIRRYNQNTSSSPARVADTDLENRSADVASPVQASDVNLKSVSKSTTEGGLTREANDPELPIPEDTQAIVNYYTREGRPRISDVAVIWQKRQDNYVDFLRNESLEQGVYRTYMVSELMSVMGNFPNTSPSYPDHITLLARTRRFSKLLWELNQAKAKGQLDDLVNVIDATVKGFTEARRQTTEQLMRMMDRQPESFRPDAPEAERHKVVDMINGFGLTGLDVPDGVIPVSLTGTQLGVVANTFLLGLTEQPKAVRTLLDIVGYDDDPLITKLAQVSGQKRSNMMYEFTFENRVVLADALDRVIMACALNQTVGTQALDVAREYAQWHENQNFPERRGVEVFSYDSSQTPYHLPGYILGVEADADIQTTTLELPLELVISSTEYIPDEEIVGRIIEFAERFQVALDQK
ncbi:MAG TPA: hypothetical protein VMX13_17385 [Sedimentisphaerales bacterium]|nr:hypothetical protein [Sedimentisphaerales bacterium]